MKGKCRGEYRRGLTKPRGRWRMLRAIFGAKHQVSPERAALVWKAIALHTSPGIPTRLAGEIALVHLGGRCAYAASWPEGDRSRINDPQFLRSSCLRYSSTSSTVLRSHEARHTHCCAAGIRLPPRGPGAHDRPSLAQLMRQSAEKKQHEPFAFSSPFRSLKDRIASSHSSRLRPVSCFYGRWWSAPEFDRRIADHRSRHLWQAETEDSGES
jgi:hypothetical protein